VFAILALAPIVTGVGIGYLCGGRLSELSGRFRAVWLLWLAAAVQALHNASARTRHVVTDRMGVSMLIIVFGIGLLWMAVNLRHWKSAMRLAGVVVMIGAIANCAAVVANGRMPYSAEAAAIVGVPAGATTPKNEPAVDHTRLVWLIDNLPIPLINKIVSVGDVLIAAGTVALLVSAMRRRRLAEVFESRREEVKNDT
jgi:hypothetical protein